jgi:hypothetical protein
MAATKKIPSWNATGAVLATMVPQFAPSPRWNEYRVWDVWEEAVGETLARKACPTKIQNGKLFVTVSSSVMMQELQFAKATLRERLNKKLGASVVRDIMFVIGRVSDRVLRQSIPAQRPLPIYTELTMPPLSRPEIEAALSKLIEARRRRLLQKGERRSGITSRESGKTV